jgi:hypothetical protein
VCGELLDEARKPTPLDGAYVQRMHTHRGVCWRTQNLTGTQRCNDCPKGTVTRVTGLTEITYCNDHRSSKQYCPKGHWASKVAYLAQKGDATLECTPAKPGTYVKWAGPDDGVAWKEDKVIKHCKANTITPDKAMTECVACLQSSYANQEGIDGTQPHSICLPCTLFGSESDYCSASTGSIIGTVRR